MARFYWKNKNINIKNDRSRIVYFDKQQLPKNDFNNYKISSILKLTKELEQENCFRKKLLRKYIIFQLQNYDLVCVYIDLEKQSPSWAIKIMEILEKKQKKNSKRVQNQVSK